MKNLKLRNAALIFTFLAFMSLFAVKSCSYPNHKGEGEVEKIDYRDRSIEAVGGSKILREIFLEDGYWMSTNPFHGVGKWESFRNGAVCVVIEANEKKEYEGRRVCRSLTKKEGDLLFPNAYNTDDIVEVRTYESTMVRR